MKNLYIKWLIWRGYRPDTYLITAWSLHSPPFIREGYTPTIVMRKGASFKRIRFEELITSSEDESEKLCKEIVQSIDSLVK